MMGYVEQPTPWHRYPSRFRHREGNGGPLRRDPTDRLGGGVASGVAAWKGFSVTAVRIAFVLLALVTSGIAVAVYVLAWLVIEDSSRHASFTCAREAPRRKEGWNRGHKEYLLRLP